MQVLKVFKTKSPSKCQKIPEHVLSSLPGDTCWDLPLADNTMEAGETPLSPPCPFPLRVPLQSGRGEQCQPISPFPLEPGRWVSAFSEVDGRRAKDIEKALRGETIDLGGSHDEGFRKMCWGGIPWGVRNECWMLLCGYTSLERKRRSMDLVRKREEYWAYVNQYFAQADVKEEGRLQGIDAAKIIRIIRKDVPRTNPKVALFQATMLQEMLERILFIWALRHPASGYVQGMNDLVTPFVVVFLAPHIPRDVLLCGCLATLQRELAKLERIVLQRVEADSYWCFSYFLHFIQDNYTEHQPGIQKKLWHLDSMLQRIDPGLHSHLKSEEVELVQFAFKWVNCLLLRELPLDTAIRLWDTYLSEGDDFPTLHVYVCLALLLRWSDELRTLEFSNILMFLQQPPTELMTERECEEIIAKAYQYQQLIPPP